MSALGVSTHRLVNREAALSLAALDAVLRQSLGLTEGLATVLTHDSRRQNVREWLEGGGEREDDRLRFLRHFHDPLKPWEHAGLNRGFGEFSSSVRWMQDPAQAGVLSGGNWSWPDARRLYYQALTEADPDRRMALWADLFRALGQIMHLVVDASVPEHTRNDMHPLGALRVESSYERWVSSQHGPNGSPAESVFAAKYLLPAVGFDPAILTLAHPLGEEIATVPIARLIDADRYDGSNPAATVGADPRAPAAAGLAEIANANFFSEDTLRGQYPSPADAGLIPVTLPTPLGRVRRYWSRPPGLGLLPANPLRAECVTERFTEAWGAAPAPPFPCVDAAVWGQVAAHMLPRAVGYARGVLDYFFRGALRVKAVTVNDPVPGLDIPGLTGIWIDIENASDEPMAGVLEVYARFEKGTAAERRRRAAEVNGGASIVLDPHQAGRFRLSVLPGEPSAYHVLVFRGRLGAEDDAVSGQIFTVPDVRVIQQSYEAGVTKTCTPRRIAPSSSIPLDERLWCSWQPINHRVEGRFLTNLADLDRTSRDGPAIERIQAFWTGGAGGPAPVTIDGITYADGVWRRLADEPNPETFRVLDPAVRGDSTLSVTVSVRGHAAPFTAPLATFKGIAMDSAEKKVAALHSQELWLIYATQWVRIPVNVPATLVPISIGGFPAPTPLTVTEVVSDVPFFTRETFEVTREMGWYRALTFFQKVPWKPPTDYHALWDAIPLEARFPEPPGMHWSAELQPRPLEGLARAFWQAFVASDEPPASPVVLTGHEASP